MFENFNFDVTVEQLQAYQQWEAAIMQNLHNLGIDPGTSFEPLVIDPALEQAVHMQAMNNVAVAPQAQQNIQVAPVAPQEPIAQGIQNNGDIGFPTFDPVHLDANQLANIVSADTAKVEQATDSDHDTGIASDDDVDAEGEPADFPGLIGFPNPVPMASEDVAALVRLSALPTDQLSQVILDLQNSLRLREISMMPGEEMDIDQPEQIDGIPTFADAPLSATNDIQNVQVQAQPTHNANRPRPDIRSFPPPDHTRESRDQYLIDRRADGYTYREIKEAGGYDEAEPTLRGKWRTLTKEPEQRLRKPKWEQHDLELLRTVTYRWFTDNNKQVGDARPPWKILAQEMFDEGASYHFGSGTISKMWEVVHARDRDNALQEIALANANSNV
ncbi:hypothetical protein NCS57_00644500 [Fusarium keratoplasticum]|uniref:Uncharacterized protein n=1 Tax=Fusarium keratoplasticum TaxID=1328300 RepID=A0ACC0R3E7_9HYPO|nr:hypothetical protein NCS57_00644500 [Fusarium keratoplasticum]KAI8671687.1 hypothetical protein NCS57_00644500 [Fusarium keratoplasticum]